MKKRTFIIIALTLSITGLTWTGISPLFFANAETKTDSAPYPGFTAPDFTLNTPEGIAHTLSEYQGQPVLVFIWTSWCSICKATMPDLEAVYQDFGDRFTILAVNAAQQDDQAAAADYFAAQGYSYTILVDTGGEVSRAYQLRALPTSVLLDQNGKVIDVVVGAGMNEAHLRVQLSNLLEAKE